ncbi:MauE/DoxX family redox-associated membrane protein [Solitalea canadensis]|uniref:MauE/DoxX family redox-associated membrane protein n=1 Tax=Solitalea canadensis TaxID=995 RepID=UPI003898F98B
MIITINFSYYIPCSCGGLLSSLSWNEHIAFNIFFIVLIILALYLREKTPSKLIGQSGES